MSHAPGTASMNAILKIMLVSNLLVSSLLTSACRTTQASGDDVPTFIVAEPEPFVREIPAEGHLEAAEATPISTPPDANQPMKISWLAPDGEPVAKDQVVARFDDTEMKLKLEDSLASMDATGSKMAKEKVDGALMRTRRDRSADVAAEEAAFAREFESDDANIFSRMELLDTAIDLDLALAKAEHARRVKTIERKVSSGKLDLLGIERKQAEREVTHAREGLTKLEVRAQHEGLFVLERGWRGDTMKVGDTVWPGQKLAEIPLVTTLEAKLYVLEADAGSVTTDLPASVEVEAHPGQHYDGKIKELAKLASRRNPKVPVQFFEVTVELDKTDPATMSVGQRVRARIEIRDDAALIVPRQAVFERNTKSVVYRRAGAEFEPVEVTLGPASAGRIIVRNGLEPGDAIALRDPTRSLDDMRKSDDDATAAAKPEAK